MLLINNQEVEKLFSMKDCLAALEDGYDDLMIGDAVYRPRLDLWMPCERPDGYWRWGTMEGASRKIGVFAIRMKSDVVYWPGGETEEKYCMQPGTWCGLVMVFSVRNGEPLAMINDGLLQHMRVGGCAGLGVKYLAREDACDVGIFGSGGMARSYLEAFYEVRKLRQGESLQPDQGQPRSLRPGNDRQTRPRSRGGGRAGKSRARSRHRGDLHGLDANGFRRIPSG